LRAPWFFLFFFVSGFCGLVYEIVWLRLAMASFGVTTPIVSMVLSIFMGGLALGSWAAGRLTVRLQDRSAAAPLRLYALAELAIGLSGVAVPPGLRMGHEMLSRMGGGIAWGSAGHHVASGACIALVLLPFATAMGTTFPLAMASFRKIGGADSARSFSYLYLANVLGATAGTLSTAIVLIELLGFRGTLWLSGSMNALLAAVVFALSRSVTDAPYSQPPGSEHPGVARPTREGRTDAASSTLGLLFLTGLTSMALEVVWVRQLTPFLGTVVYAFATILTVYLLATFLGSAVYRRWSASAGHLGDGTRLGSLWLGTGCFALLSLAAADPRLGQPGLGMASLARVLLGVGPFSAAVGFLTPLLVDRWSCGAPQRAGSAYAVNVIGCIIGPLLSSFVLLPWIGERWALLLLSAPLFVFGLFAVATAAAGSIDRSRRRSNALTIVGSATLAALLIVLTRDFESSFPHAVVRRDSTATVIALGDGMDKALLVNGSTMTLLTTVTKTLAHLPLAFLQHEPRDVLVICFGMGTSFRSALSWSIPTTSVDLIPSVPGLFSYFHADATEVLARPGARVVVDDGRRFLERTTDTYDVITVDPPPPVEAAGSSLLYSREFYAAARLRLRPGGILQQWFPGTYHNAASAFARAIKESFPYVRAFRSYKTWGLHFLASDRPIPALTADELAMKLPALAVADMVEWEPERSPWSIFDSILKQEIPLEGLMAVDPTAPTVTDDRPVNEYYLIHEWLHPQPAEAARH
jgi:spermidine synthase